MILFRFAMKTIKKLQLWQLILWEELSVLHTVFKLNERFLKMCLELFFPDVYRQKEILFIVSSIALRPFLQCILMNMINNIMAKHQKYMKQKVLMMIFLVLYNHICNNIHYPPSIIQSCLEAISPFIKYFFVSLNPGLWSILYDST